MDHFRPQSIKNDEIKTYPGLSEEETSAYKKLAEKKHSELTMNDVKAKMGILKIGEAGQVTESELRNAGFKSLHRVSFIELIGTMQCLMEFHHIEEMAKNLVAIALDCPTGREVVFSMPDDDVIVDDKEGHPDVIENNQDGENDNAQLEQASIVQEEQFDISKLSDVDRSIYQYYDERRKIKIIDEGVEDFIKKQFEEELSNNKLRKFKIKLIEAVFNQNGIDGPKPYNYYSKKVMSDEALENLFKENPQVFPSSFIFLIKDGKEKIAQSIRVFCLLFLKMIYRDDKAYKTKLPKIITMETICFLNMSVIPINTIPSEAAMTAYRKKLPFIYERIPLTKSIITTYTFAHQIPPIKLGLNWILMTSACLTGFGILRLIVATAKKLRTHPVNLIEFNIDTETLHEFRRFDRDLEDILLAKGKEVIVFSGMYAENMRPNLKLALFPRFTSFCVGIAEAKDQIRPIYPSFASYSTAYIQKGKRFFNYIIYKGFKIPEQEVKYPELEESEKA